MIIYADNENSQQSDKYKKAVLEILTNTYGNISLPLFASNAHSLKEISKGIISSSEPIFIWNNLKPYSVWAIDLCRRFNKDYVVIERGIVPSQGEDNFSFYAGGICFDNLNIQPKYFDPSSYEKNLDVIEKHYKNNNLSRQKEKDKIVIIGQLLFDSTITHYSNFNDYEELIDMVVRHEQININDTEIVYCSHPRHKITHSKYCISNQQTIRECLDAKMVYAVSSTTIYEIYGLDIPTTIMGFAKNAFPTTRGWNNRFECLSTALDYHFNSKTSPQDIKNKVNKIIEISREYQK